VHQQVLDQIMVANLKDEAQSWNLDSEGHYARDPADRKGAFSAHEYFMTNPSLSGRGHKVKTCPPSGPCSTRRFWPASVATFPPPASCRRRRGPGPDRR
jgi:hypothetical protein